MSSGASLITGSSPCAAGSGPDCFLHAASEAAATIEIKPKKTLRKNLQDPFPADRRRSRGRRGGRGGRQNTAEAEPDEQLLADTCEAQRVLRPRLIDL